MPAKNGSFEVPYRSAKIVFEDGDYAGLEIHCYLDIPLEEFFGFQRLLEGEGMEKGLRAFGDDILQSWNLTIEAAAVPASGEGFMRLPLRVALHVVARWVEAISEVPAPLVKPSPHGSAKGQRSRPSS